MNDSRKQHVTYDGDQEEVLVRQKKSRINGPFQAISPLTNKKSRSRYMQPDVFDRLAECTKGAFTVFNNLKYHRSEDTNITSYTSEEEMSKSQKETLSRHLAELKKAGIIRNLKSEIQIGEDHAVMRVKEPRRVFIISPELIKCKDHDRAHQIWSQCQ